MFQNLSAGNEVTIGQLANHGIASRLCVPSSSPQPMPSTIRPAIGTARIRWRLQVQRKIHDHHGARWIDKRQKSRISAFRYILLIHMCNGLTLLEVSTLRIVKPSVVQGKIHSSNSIHLCGR